MQKYLEDLEKFRKSLEGHEEDYPGQNNDIRRQKVIELAVTAADELIMEGSNGETQETDYLTGAVALKFTEKVQGRLQSELMRHDSNERFSKRLDRMT